ncbi:MAG: type II toxin-antitoxin system death-on-curing family toxin [Planctomycetaceae bacterium]|nr:type II toxin-antitoxin system death-on-curing family toxin [Planctomycetaceae bacterium]
MDTVFLTVEDVLHIHADQIRRYGGSAELSDGNLLDAAVAMPRQQFGGQLLHPDLASMGAAYLFHLVKNHPFVDGNKRVGAAAANVFVRLNGYQLNCTNEDLVQLVLSVAVGQTSKDEAAAFFGDHLKALTP